MIFIECLTFVLIFGAVCAAYELGRGGKRPRDPHPGFHQIHQYSPPVEAVLDYRTQSGSKTLRNMRIVRSLHRPDGGLYLFGFCDRSNRPRIFRVDRIACLATVDGETIDTRRFLIERLGVPAELCAGGQRRTKRSPIAAAPISPGSSL